MPPSSFASVAGVSSHVDVEAMEALLEAVDGALDVDNVADGEQVQSARDVTGSRHQLHDWNGKTQFSICICFLLF